MGVDFRLGKWRARISINSKRLELGRFATKEEAQAAYARALVDLGQHRKRVARPMLDPAIRFWSKVEKRTDGCWLWRAAQDKDGYGKFQLNGGGKQRHVRAHRFSFWLAHGRWPSKFALHACDTPSCVNPDHLGDGDQAQNQRDAVARGRTNRGEANANASMTEKQAREILRLWADGTTQVEIRRRIGCSKTVVWGIVHRRSWVWLTT